MNILLKKVTTPQVIPSGTGQTVSTKSSKNIGILLFKNTPRRIQEAYNVTKIKTQTFQFLSSNSESYQIDLLGLLFHKYRLCNFISFQWQLIKFDKTSYIHQLFASVLWSRQEKILLLDDSQFICFIFMVDYGKAQKQFYHKLKGLFPLNRIPGKQRNR